MIATTGGRAVDLWRTGQFDVILMDMLMPEMDGIACLQAVMKVDPTLSVLVVSALDDKSTAIKAMKLGARGFIRKPFTDEQLVNALLQIIERS